MSDMPGFNRINMNPGPNGIVAGKDQRPKDLQEQIDSMQDEIKEIKETLDMLHSSVAELQNLQG